MVWSHQQGLKLVNITSSTIKTKNDYIKKSKLKKPEGQTKPAGLKTTAGVKNRNPPLE